MHRSDQAGPGAGRRSRPDTLTTYLEDAGSHPVMDAGSERRSAIDLLEARRRLGHALLAEPPARTLIVELLEQRLGKRAPCNVVIAYARGRARPDVLLEALATADPANEAVLHVARALGASAGDVCGKISGMPGGAAYLDRLRAARRAYFRARERFIAANLRLVVSVASRHRHFGVSLADRIQDGNLGLIEAVERFDPHRGVRFSTYAVWWIRHAVNRAAQNNPRPIRVPTHVYTRHYKAGRVGRALATELGREPTLHEVAAAMRDRPQRLLEAADAMRLRAVGLEEPQGWTGRAPVEHLEDAGGTACVIAVEREFDRAAVWSAVRSRLHPIERDILHRRFVGEGTTLQEIGRHHNLSRERIRQLIVGAIGKLRRVLSEASARHENVA